MIAKIEKLIDSLQLLADMAAVALQQKNNPMQTIAGDQNPPAAPAPAPKKAKAPKEPKAPPADEKIEDQLGLGAEEPKKEEPKKELTDKELQARVEEVTRQYVGLCKNEPVAAGRKNAGQDRAIALLQGTFKAQSLPLMSREQKVEWIATMEKWIAEYK